MARIQNLPPRRPLAGFTLIELMIVVSIIAMIAAVAVPRFVSARVSANENAAIGTLRTIAAAQAQMMASGAIDTDADGGGEAGYFGELSGAVATRIWAVGGPTVGGNSVRPPQLSKPFRVIVSDGTDGVVQNQGYYYKMFLPDDSIAPPVGARPEAPTGGPVPGALPGSANTEIYWCCYAWPVQHSRTGYRAFMVNQEGDIVSTRNIPAQPGGSYDGLQRVPAFDAAFSVAGDMTSDPGLTVNGLAAQDGAIWTPVGN